jgi:hypothetical protein
LKQEQDGQNFQRSGIRTHWTTDPNPALFFSGFQKNKIKSQSLFFLLFTVGKFVSVIKDNKLLGRHKPVEIKVFLIFFLLVDERIRIRTNNYLRIRTTALNSLTEKNIYIISPHLAGQSKTKKRTRHPLHKESLHASRLQPIKGKKCGGKRVSVTQSETRHAEEIPEISRYTVQYTMLKRPCLYCSSSRAIPYICSMNISSQKFSWMMGGSSPASEGTNSCRKKETTDCRAIL